MTDAEGPWKLDSDEVVIQVPKEKFASLSRETMEALEAYSTRKPWPAKGGICYVVSKSRVQELCELASSAKGKM